RAEAHHGHLLGVLGHLHGGGASGIAGGLALLVGDEEAAAPVHKAAAGHQLHRIGLTGLFHPAVDADEKILVHKLAGSSFWVQYCSMSIWLAVPSPWGPMNSWTAAEKLSGESLMK